MYKYTYVYKRKATRPDPKRVGLLILLNIFSIFPIFSMYFKVISDSFLFVMSGEIRYENYLKACKSIFKQI